MHNHPVYEVFDEIKEFFRGNTQISSVEKSDIIVSSISTGIEINRFMISISLDRSTLLSYKSEFSLSTDRFNKRRDLLESSIIEEVCSNMDYRIERNDLFLQLFGQTEETTNGLKMTPEKLLLTYRDLISLNYEFPQDFDILMKHLAATACYYTLILPYLKNISFTKHLLINRSALKLTSHGGYLLKELENRGFSKDRWVNQKIAGGHKEKPYKNQIEDSLKSLILNKDHKNRMKYIKKNGKAYKSKIAKSVLKHAEDPPVSPKTVIKWVGEYEVEEGKDFFTWLEKQAQ